MNNWKLLEPIKNPNMHNLIIITRQKNSAVAKKRDMMDRQPVAVIIEKFEKSNQYVPIFSHTISQAKS